MAYETIIKTYLKSVQEQYQNAIISGQYTAELSYRVPLDLMLKALAKEFNPKDDIDVILEPSNQGKVGRPDWRIHNKKTLGIFGYIEGKGLSSAPFNTTPYAQQIKKYLSLDHKLIITDGIDFVFCMDKDADPIVISIIDKKKMTSKSWMDQKYDARFEVFMRNFFRNPAPQLVNESKLIELVAIRTRILADEILPLSNIDPEEAMDQNEKKAIQTLLEMKKLVYSHNDTSLRTGEVFSDFTAQVIMFCLLYAHRVFCAPDDSPAEKERKIYNFIRSDFEPGDALTPFRDLLLYLRDNSNTGFFINQYIDECIKFLSFVKMTDYQLLNPDYHQLFEMFLSKYDAKTRFDYGAYYTPKVLADYVVRLTNYVAESNFSGKTIYAPGNTIIDPCCGTGTFMEEIILHDTGNKSYNLSGIEILPTPYMLAHYRMSILAKQKGIKKNTVEILLANTLCNSVFDGKADANSIEGRELIRANKLSSPPLKLVIGNPPCSDALRTNNSDDFSIINKLMEDFRPPESIRRSRQNIQKQIGNPFMQFLRWSCKKLIDSPNHSILSFVVPLSFIEAESYKYARKYLTENFSDIWAVAVDADARTGIRSDSLFHTLQGRAIIILARKIGQKNTTEQFKFRSYDDLSRSDKEKSLQENISDIIDGFITYSIDKDTYSFIPSKAFNTKMYRKFWPVSGEKGQKAIFSNHCSGIKLAPTALFTHVKEPMLKRRSKDIAAYDIDQTRSWFSGQEKPPKDEKIVAFQDALKSCGNITAIDRMLSANIHKYSFRPFLTTNVLLWKDLLRKYSQIGGGGTRLRPEIIEAYENNDVIGFAMAHAPKDLHSTLTQFVSFCWYYPDNDMCSRGNSHIYMNNYPCDGRLVNNIDEDLISMIKSVTGKTKNEISSDIVYYSYAILCSQKYLDEFEGALFTVNQSDKRARIPIVADKEIFNQVVNIGMKIAELEKIDFKPINILKFNYEELKMMVPDGFHLKRTPNVFDEENELLILSDGKETITIDCPISLQRLNISGYDVIKSVWLKFNSYDFTNHEFTSDDMELLLDFLNIIAMHEQYVEEIDEVITPVLDGNVKLIENPEE